ncbi:MAG: PKD domain-containing protein [Kofleriaceae bacterium]|nr:PKD domain-containing protein [Kofleriaceae bacterium]
MPWVATDPTVPHQAYNGHATTFKAIARGGDGNYTVEWDFDGDGTFDTTFPTTNRYNLAATFTYPDQVTTTGFNAVVRVTSNGETVTGTYPVRVFADVPADPGTATDRQLQVMRGVAVDDALWYLHNQMTRTGNEGDALYGAQASGNIPAGYPEAATAGFLWSLSLNGHFAAFPPAYIGALPDAADNSARWDNDPYAEDAMRAVNYMLPRFVILTGIPAADESNLSGFYPEVQKTPINGTDDGVAFWHTSGEDSYVFGHMLASFAVSNLKGFVAQVGDPTYVLGRRFEYIVQQMVDGMVYAQNDTGTGTGTWYYTANAGGTDTSTSLWGVTGLWHADEFAGGWGVIVPNLAKARLAVFVATNYQSPAAGERGNAYSTGYTTPGFTTTALSTLAMGWVGANTFDATDTRIAFPGYSTITRGALRTHHDAILNFIGNRFLTGYSGSIGWNTGFVTGGDFSRVDGQGTHYAMLHWQDAARAVVPEITQFGGNEWARLFSQYFINNQAADGGWNWSYANGANSDNTGGPTLRAVWAILVLSPDAIPPLAIGESSVATAPEGTVISFDGSESDPGTGNPVYTWDFANGDTLPGQNVTYAFPDDGAFDVTLTSTSIGGTSVDTIPVVITNVAPTANAGPDLVANEGDAVPFAVTFTDPGTADTHTFAWTFGDTTGDTAQNPNHAYADNGTYAVTVAVTDDDGGVGNSGLTVTVNNVAPTITSTPGTSAVEGTAYTYTVTFTDPGVADTHTCSAPVVPAGMTLTGCTVDWTPNFTQALGASAPVTVCVTDDDNGQTCQSFDIDVTFVDTDGDGLPDSWENANFGDITSQDQFGDPDGDGMNNLQEFNNVTDPLTYDGPSAPVAASPTCGGEINSLQTILVADNAVDPQGTALDYEFELYSDVGLTILVASQAGIPEGVGGQTQWSVPVNLLENQTYYWRVRAEDQFTFGQFSATCSFFVNTVNEAPGAPRINTPAFGGQVNSLTPTLTVDNATDVDMDPLTYTFEVYSDPALSNLVASENGVASGTGTTSWVTTATLVEDTTYYWRARATDDEGLDGDWSQNGKFFVTTVNAAPEAPVLVSPQNGTIVATVRPELIILNADDSDLDVVVYDWDLATDDTFGTIIDSGTNVNAQGVQNTAFNLAADLDEDTRYCWRARSDDGQATSAYNAACFLVSTVNDPPTVPTLNNPSDGSSVVTTAPVFSWAPATDPEGENITYVVEVMDSSDTVVASVTGVSGTVTSMAGQLDNGATYTWHAKAVDAEGAESEFSEPNSFVVAAPIDNPEVVVNGGGCSTGGGEGGAAGLVLVGLGLMVARRRRGARA